MLYLLALKDGRLVHHLQAKIQDFFIMDNECQQAATPPEQTTPNKPIDYRLKSVRHGKIASIHAQAVLTLHRAYALLAYLESICLVGRDMAHNPDHAELAGAHNAVHLQVMVLNLGLCNLALLGVVAPCHALLQQGLEGCAQNSLCNFLGQRHDLQGKDGNVTPLTVSLGEGGGGGGGDNG